MNRLYMRFFTQGLFQHEIKKDKNYRSNNSGDDDDDDGEEEATGHLEEALHVLQHVHPTVAEVVLLRDPGARALHHLLPEAPLVPFTHLPLHLQVPTTRTDFRLCLGRFSDGSVSHRRCVQRPQER